MQRLLVSVRGKKEALAAVEGGAHIVDVEFPGSALGTPYPLNIVAVREGAPQSVAVSTNIGEEQLSNSTACQAALGVGVAGADIIKAGLAHMTVEDSTLLAERIVRSVKHFWPDKQVIPAFFADAERSQRHVAPDQAAAVGADAGADGVLIDTFDKSAGLDLVNLLGIEGVAAFVSACHEMNLTAWIAGSVKLEQLADLWGTGVDVICVRAAACESGSGEDRMATVTATRVAQLVRTLPA